MIQRSVIQALSDCKVSHVKIAVLGAGVTGVTSAYFLAKKGYEVTVFDRQPYAAEETSFANGGQLSFTQTFPWASPDLPSKLVKWLGRDDAPLVFKLRNDPHMWMWGLKFLWSTREKTFYESAGRVLRLALHSRDALHKVIEDEGIKFDRQQRGILKLFDSEEGYRHMQSRTKWLNDQGVDQTMLSRAECLEAEPALGSATSSFIGGAKSEIDESGDARLFTLGLKEAAEKMGVQFKLGCDIEKLNTDEDLITSISVNGQTHIFDKYVMSLGSYSYFLAKKIGLHLPIYPVKGYSVTIPIEGANDAPLMSLTDESQHVVISRFGDRLRAAGTAEMNGYQLEPNKKREDMVLDSVLGLFPNVGDRTKAERWCGLRPMTTDSTPIIGKSKYTNLFLNTGHCQLGWTLSCGSAQLLAEMIAGSPTELDMSDYSLDRF
ncbi:FAD-dependent oxidoreductase [Sneathiella sp. P13V-1]|uniref:D-amino acid dehydrogenase n=1 Tax=Sneathiella sp. P13V-1 TaxID=2697366 RepID=UPI00187BB588|nr:D-amino acid dehydrogenase [Sneathiella sp. P13V-1]MBE7637110.1 FAD-dependent oxidoreductase [Sneathiella sp. P13V-1]